MGSSASFFEAIRFEADQFRNYGHERGPNFKPLVLGKCSGKNCDGKNDIRISESRINLFFNNLL